MKYIIYQNGAGGWRWALFPDDEAVTKPVAVAPIAYRSEEACREMLDFVRRGVSAPIEVERRSDLRRLPIDPDRC